MSRPLTVVISDVHYNINTLELADKSVRTAMNKASSLGVPLVIAGDLHDTKAILRGECVNRMIDTFSTAPCKVFIIVGNHCMLNEKGSDHSLHFLSPYAEIISSPRRYIDTNKMWHAMLIPYQTNQDTIIKLLKDESTPRALIMHQGVQTAYMGHYAQDKSSLPPEVFDGFRVISGHYHRRQDIKCGKTGLFSYVGNPYSLNFGEAEDGPKGYQILMDDGSLEFVPLNLRKHMVVNCDISELPSLTALSYYNDGDLVWIKVSGPRSKLSNLNKVELGMRIFGHANYKLDLIPTDQEKLTIPVQDLTSGEILDLMIDGTGEDEEHRQKLKVLWREIL